MTLKRMTVWMGMLALLAGSAAATDAKLQGDVYSAYVWRGITINKDPVLQPSLDVALPEGFDLTLWGNLDMGDNHGEFQQGKFSENDLILSYGFTTGAVTVTAGYIGYLYPGQLDVARPVDANAAGAAQTNAAGALPGTGEVYGGLDVDLGLGFAANMYLYYDVDEIKDLYANAGVTYSYECSAKVTTDVGASIGYAGKDWAAYNSGGTDGGFNEYTVTLGIKCPIGKTMEVGALIAYTDSVDKNVLPDQPTHVYGGASLACEF